MYQRKAHKHTFEDCEEALEEGMDCVLRRFVSPRNLCPTGGKFKLLSGGGVVNLGTVADKDRG